MSGIYANMMGLGSPISPMTSGGFVPGGGGMLENMWTKLKGGMASPEGQDMIGLGAASLLGGMGGGGGGGGAGASIGSGLGTAAGAAIGSMIAPGVGTAIGGSLGGALGGAIGGGMGGDDKSDAEKYMEKILKYQSKQVEKDYYRGENRAAAKGAAGLAKVAMAPFIGIGSKVT